MKRGRHKITQQISRICICCGNDFLILNTQYCKRRIFCSASCSNRFKNSGRVHLHRRSELITIKCKYKECNNNFQVKYKNRNRKFCSRKCADKGKNNIWRIWRPTKMQKKKSIIKRLETLKKNNKLFPNCDTKCELIFESYLKELNINYRKQEIISIWTFDFYLPDFDIYIEVDGDYWHANPKFFTKLNNGQKRRIARDKSKNSFMKNKSKKLIRFWENEVLDKKQYIINKLQSICNLKNVSLQA